MIATPTSVGQPRRTPTKSHHDAGDSCAISLVYLSSSPQSPCQRSRMNAHNFDLISSLGVCVEMWRLFPDLGRDAHTFGLTRQIVTPHFDLTAKVHVTLRHKGGNLRQIFSLSPNLEPCYQAHFPRRQHRVAAVVIRQPLASQPPPRPRSVLSAIV